MILGAAAALYVVVCMLFFFAQRSMIFPAPPGEGTPAQGSVVRGEGFCALDAPILEACRSNAEHAGESQGWGADRTAEPPRR
jgi:hypothetical protein